MFGYRWKKRLSSGTPPKQLLVWRWWTVILGEFYFFFSSHPSQHVGREKYTCVLLSGLIFLIFSLRLSTELFLNTSFLMVPIILELSGYSESTFLNLPNLHTCISTSWLLVNLFWLFWKTLPWCIVLCFSFSSVFLSKVFNLVFFFTGQKNLKDHCKTVEECRAFRSIRQFLVRVLLLQQWKQKAMADQRKHSTPNRSVCSG